MRQVFFLPRAIVSLAVLSLAVLPFAGCGGSMDPFSYVKGKGKITFDDGTLISAPRIQLTFVLQAPPDPNSKFSPPHGIGEVNVADGTYDIRSHLQEGLVPGKHKVIVRCIDAKEREIKTLIGTEYGNIATTPLVADTANPDSFNFTIKKYSGPAPGAVAPSPQRRPLRPNGQR
jgi:hypothetical protein